MSRIAFLHTGAIVIPIVGREVAAHLPGAEVLNLLDDKIVADLRAGDAAAASVPERLTNLAATAKAAGAEVLMFTCSSISAHAAAVAEAAGIPTLRIDEAMADDAVAAGARIAVLATLPTTLEPTIGLLRERAALAEATPDLQQVLLEGAFEAAVAGDQARHDALVAAAVTAAAEGADVVVLAQASMATAAAAAPVDVPVLTSPGPGVARLAQFLQTN